MKRDTQFWLVVISCAAQLLTTGCLGGGSGGTFGDLSGSDGSEPSEAFGSFASGGSDGVIGAPEVATVNNPEPASLALFGGGLAGIALWRRRKSHRSSFRNH